MKYPDIINNEVAQRHPSYTAEEYAKKICFTQEEFEELARHDFYRNECPSNDEPASVEEQIENLDAADEEGYVSQEEVDHLKSLWNHVD